MICVWRVFSHYKLPLWAESHADPRKIQANMLTDQWRQQVTHNLQRQAMYSSWYRVYTSMQLKSTLRAVKLNCKTGCLKSANHIISFEWRNYILTNVGIHTICALYRILPLKSFSFVNYCWYPFHHSPSHGITCYSQNGLFLVCFRDSKMWHFTREVSASVCGLSPRSCKLCGTILNYTSTQLQKLSWPVVTRNINCSFTSNF